MEAEPKNTTINLKDRVKEVLIPVRPSKCHFQKRTWKLHDTRRYQSPETEGSDTCPLQPQEPDKILLRRERI